MSCRALQHCTAPTESSRGVFLSLADVRQNLGHYGEESDKTASTKSADILIPVRPSIRHGFSKDAAASSEPYYTSQNKDSEYAFTGTNTARPSNKSNLRQCHSTLANPKRSSEARPEKAVLSDLGQNLRGIGVWNEVTRWMRPVKHDDRAGVVCLCRCCLRRQMKGGM